VAYTTDEKVWQPATKTSLGFGWMKITAVPMHRVPGRGVLH
jgi:hypothetical protein